MFAVLEKGFSLLKPYPREISIDHTQVFLQIVHPRVICSCEKCESLVSAPQKRRKLLNTFKSSYMIVFPKNKSPKNVLKAIYMDT